MPKLYLKKLNPIDLICKVEYLSTLLKMQLIKNISIHIFKQSPTYGTNFNKVRKKTYLNVNWPEKPIIELR